MENFFLFLWYIGVDLWEEGKYVKLALFILGLFTSFGAFVLLFWMLVNLALAHFETLLLVCGIPVGAVAALRYALGHRKDVPPPPPPVSDELVLERAKQGLNALTEIVFAVLRDLAEYTAIVRPGSLGELPCPNKSHCIQVKDGVAIISMMAHCSGEVDDKQFVELFNLRLSQRLDARDLPNLPDAVFYDSKNNPHTSIQAIGCTPCGAYLKLDIIQVNEAAVALIEAKALAATSGGDTPAPPASPYF